MRPVAHESWMARAACKGMDPELFFPTHKAPNTAIAEARKVCARCPVAARCLVYAQANNIGHGVWGGETVKGRTDRGKTTNPRNLTRVRELSHAGLDRASIASAAGLTMRQVDLCRRTLRRDSSCLLVPGCTCGPICSCRYDDACPTCDCDPKALVTT